VKPSLRRPSLLKIPCESLEKAKLVADRIAQKYKSHETPPCWWKKSVTIERLSRFATSSHTVGYEVIRDEVVWQAVVEKLPLLLEDVLRIRNS
jgi:hypothetical protein